MRESVIFLLFNFKFKQRTGNQLRQEFVLETSAHFLGV